MALNTLSENINKDEGGGSLVSSNVVALKTLTVNNIKDEVGVALSPVM